MGVIANFLVRILGFINFLLTAYVWMIIGRAIISWVNADPYNPIVRFLHEVTEPALSRVRRMVPFASAMGGIDLTPLILIFGIYFIQQVIIPTLQQMILALA